MRSFDEHEGEHEWEHEAVAKRQHNADTQFGRAAVQILSVNERLNQILIEHSGFELRQIL